MLKKQLSGATSAPALRWKAPEGQCAKSWSAPTPRGALRPTGREMKLTDLFSRARKRAHYPNEIEVPARLGNDAVDRSSMADLVRLLKEAEDEGSSRQPA
jgi:hypothetical protein